jgi:hypothetical protein
MRTPRRSVGARSQHSYVADVLCLALYFGHLLPKGIYLLSVLIQNCPEFANAFEKASDGNDDQDVVWDREVPWDVNMA